MPTIISERGRIEVPKSENIIVKVSGWVKYQKNGEIHHLPPNQVVGITEEDPDIRKSMHSNSEHIESSVVYQNPHGRV